MRVLMWFRSDLRVADNRALDHAGRVADDGIVAVFHVADRQWLEHDWGPVKADFVLRNVAALREKLGKLNIPLLVRRVPEFDGAPGDLLTVARKHGCDRLVFNREYEVNEHRRDIAVDRAFHDAGLTVRSFHDQTVIRPDAIETGSHRFYTVYTPFKNNWLDHVRHAPDRDPLPAPKKQKKLDIADDDVPQRATNFDESPVDPDAWPAGEGEARRRLKRFIDDRADAYHTDRDIPGVDGTSTLSPYLACGAISARQCLAAAIDANDGRIGSGRKGLTTWIGELAWREFYRHILVGYPRVSMHQAFNKDMDAVKWSYGEKTFERWCAGRTGVPIVDAAMRQLNTTGWMHNRCRMIAAMFLTKNLFIDWRWGERYFANHLIDLDLANNNGGWQWSASTGTDAAPYFRVFNPVSQSEKFDKAGDYIRAYVEELADVDAPEIHDPSPLTRSACDYPEAMVDLKRSRAEAIKKFKALKK